MVSKKHLANLRSNDRALRNEAFSYIYDEVKGETIKKKALELIEMEKDAKYKKKYTSVWK